MVAGFANWESIMLIPFVAKLGGCLSCVLFWLAECFVFLYFAFLLMVNLIEAPTLLPPEARSSA